jgi:hypothetical protein
MEQQAVRSEEKLQAEIHTEMAQSAPAAPKTTAAPRTPEPAPSKPAKASGSIRSSVSQTLQRVAGSFAAMAFNAAQILIVLVTVFFGVTFTLMNPRPIFGAIFPSYPRTTMRRPY